MRVKKAKRGRTFWIARRSFLKGLTAVGFITATGSLFGCGDDAPLVQSQGDTVTVHRFQTRSSRTCNACKNHQHYKVFIDEATADLNRAHPGCNCRIVTQTMSIEYWQELVPFVQDGAVDLRAIFG